VGVGDEDVEEARRECSGRRQPLPEVLLLVPLGLRALLIK
jgi:hypothetical protein